MNSIFKNFRIFDKKSTIIDNAQNPTTKGLSSINVHRPKNCFGMLDIVLAVAAILLIPPYLVLCTIVCVQKLIADLINSLITLFITQLYYALKITEFSAYSFP